MKAQQNHRLEALGENAFTRLNALLSPIAPKPGLVPLPLSVGEPQHAPPSFVAETVARHAHLWNKYPPIAGTADYRQSVAEWLCRRFSIPQDAIDADRHVLGLSGTKEGLYLIAEVAVSVRHDGRQSAVLFPNPFYQVYRGAAVMSGAEPIAVPATRETGFLPDFASLPRDVLERTAIAFLCNPANPQGAIADRAYLRRIIALAREYGFILAVDECYSELWDREAPHGALSVALEGGGHFDNVLVFHSLSKRSNAAGLRGGFVAGDPEILSKFLTLRSYGGPQVPLPIQAAAAALWRDEAHVEENRRLYRSKIDVAEHVLGDRYGFYRPPGGFFLWLDVGDSERAAAALWREAAVRSVPGAYLASPDIDGTNPGSAYLRLALVHDDATIAEALQRLITVL